MGFKKKSVQDKSNFNTKVTVDSKEEWLTPPYIIKALGTFDLDPCAPIKSIRPWNTANKHYSVLADGLSKEWKGRVWLNPPYGTKTFLWISKLAEHGNGIALIFARTETKGFHEHIWNKADAIFFFEGRLKFYHVTGKEGKSCANAPSCLVAYGSNNTEALIRAIKREKLKGKFFILKDKK